MTASERRHEQIEQIFLRARDVEGAEQRAAFLEQACGADVALRSEIEDLLRVAESPDSFLDVSALASVAETNSLDVAAERLVGPSIDRYKLLQKLGEGGMGTVFLAEQTHPIHRRVAVKIIRAGMDSTQIAARFDAERQALAMMDHPNIARVFDAGCTDEGRAYFVMELVKGIPITQFCEENKLETRERLELFLPICSAVQHAHQKGIIHRDLKPGNVLVAMYDDQPVPKVIDFGIAKATNQRLTEKTLFTMIGQIVGTWEYMSPEQAVLNQLDVDTRSDVYSLGVILYELLTGVTPIDGQQLRRAGLEETLRLIREEEPLKPSTRVTSLGQVSNAVAGYQRAGTKELATRLRGDLDWIVMKTLDKDRVRRYQSAADLADDIERHMADQPVAARAPTAIDRLRKLVRRNRSLAASLAVIFVVMVAGTAASVVAWRRAAAERERALQQQRIAEQHQVIADEQRGVAEQNHEVAVRQQAIAVQKSHEAERAIGHVRDYMLLLAMGDETDVQRAIEICNRIGAPDREIWERILRSQGALHEGRTDEGLAHLRAGLQIDPNHVGCKAMLAWACLLSGDWDDYGDLVDDLREVEPRSSEEFALVSLALHYDTDVCLRYAERALTERDSLFARLARAMAILGKVVDSGNDSRLSEAASDVEYVNRRANNNPYIWAISLFVKMAEIEFAEPRQADAADLHVEARRLISLLESAPEFHFGRSMRTYYWNRHGATEEVDAAWERVLRADSRGQLWQAVPLFLTREKQPEAVRWVTGDDAYSEAVRRVLALREPSDVPKFLEFYRERTHGKRVDFWGPIDFFLVLHAGDAQYMEQDAKERLASIESGQIEFGTHLDKATLQVLARAISEEQFIAAAHQSQTALAHCYRVLGDVNLARGNREAAIRYYEKVTQCGFFYGGDLPWAKAYLRHLKADPDWPHWIRSESVQGGHDRTN